MDKICAGVVVVLVGLSFIGLLISMIQFMIDTKDSDDQGM